jgi:CHAT domain-containing protein/tetratricopeptide (TPR) repeat protein
VLTVLSWFAPQDGVVPELRLGAPLSSEIVDGSAEVTSAGLDTLGFLAPAPGRICRFRVPKAGTYAFELRSSGFDGYLIVRGARGEVLGEDDDGWYGWHARVVLDDLAREAELEIVAAAVRGGRGPFELSVVVGRPTELSPAEVRARLEEEAAALWEQLGDAPADPARAAARLAAYGGFLDDYGALAAAVPLLERALELRESALGAEHADTAQSLDDLATNLWNRGRLAEAAALFEDALRVRERVLGAEHPKTAGSMSDLATALGDLGRRAEAVALLRRALAIHEATIGLENEDTPTILSNLGVNLWLLGSAEEAIALLQQALALQEKVLGPDHASVATTLGNLTTMLADRGRLAELTPLLERVVEIRERTLGPEHADTGFGLGSLGANVFRLGRAAEARSLFERALAIQERALGPEHPEVGNALNNLATCLWRLGRYEEALPLYERAFAIHERSAPEGAETAAKLTNLAVNMGYLGRNAEAQPLFERALALQEEALGGEHRETAATLGRLAANLWHLSRFEEAQRLLERALAIDERVLGREHLETAERAGELALGLDYLGRHGEARSFHERALGAFERTLGPEHPETARMLGNLATNQRLLGRHEEAQALLERTLAIREAVLGPAHPDCALTLKELTRNALALGDRARALDWARREAAFVQEHLARNLPGLPEDERAALAAQRFHHVEQLLSLAPEGAEDARAVVAWKGQILRLLLARVPSSARADELERELANLRGRIGDLAYDRGAADPAARTRELAELRERATARERELAQERKAAGLVLEPPSLADVRQSLGPGAALVDFIAYRSWREAPRETAGLGRWSERLLAAFVHRADRAAPARVELGPLAEVVRSIDGYRASLGVGATQASAPRPGEPRGIAAHSAPAAGDACAELFERLWTPLEPSLRGAELVFVCPDDELAGLPFGALRDGEGFYLLESRSFAVLPDAAALARARGAAAGSDSALLVGGVDYGRRAECALAAQDPLLARRGTFQGGWRELPGTRLEIEGVRKLLGNAAVEVLTDEHATEEALEARLPGKRWIHLATHGFFQPEGLPSIWAAARALSDESAPRPEILTGLPPGLLSGLVCAGADLPLAEGRDNGLLTASEIALLDLSAAELVVLSACQTAIGSARAGEGMLSVQRAFHAAGARTVVASLWNVGDAPTAELMARFYANLRGGEGKLAALRRAQLSMLADERRAGDPSGAPGTWAGFVLSGDPR